MAAECRGEGATNLGLLRAAEQGGTSSRRGVLVRSGGESWCLGLHLLGLACASNVSCCDCDLLTLSTRFHLATLPAVATPCVFSAHRALHGGGGGGGGGGGSDDCMRHMRAP